jgi:hypothetical protein
MAWAYTANYLDVMLVLGVTGTAIAWLLISGEWRKF